MISQQNFYTALLKVWLPCLWLHLKGCCVCSLCHMQSVNQPLLCLAQEAAGWASAHGCSSTAGRMLPWQARRVKLRMLQKCWAGSSLWSSKNSSSSVDVSALVFLKAFDISLSPAVVGDFLSCSYLTLEAATLLIKETSPLCAPLPTQQHRRAGSCLPYAPSRHSGAALRASALSEVVAFRSNFSKKLSSLNLPSTFCRDNFDHGPQWNHRGKGSPWVSTSMFS